MGAGVRACRCQELRFTLAIKRHAPTPMWALRRPCFLMAPDPGQPQARGADASDPTLNCLLGFYLPCIGWAILDAAVIAGVVLHAG